MNPYFEALMWMLSAAGTFYVCSKLWQLISWLFHKIIKNACYYALADSKAYTGRVQEMLVAKIDRLSDRVLALERPSHKGK